MQRQIFCILSLLIGLFSCKIGLSQKSVVEFKNVLIETDVVCSGAKGVQVKGICSFQAYKSLYNNDSLMLKAFWDNAFYLTLNLKTSDTNSITSALGYKSLFPEGKISTKIKIKPSKSDVRQGFTNFKWFVPYGMLNLKSGQQEVLFEFNFYGKDGFNNVVSGKSKSLTASFVKPKSRIFEFRLDSLSVSKYDSKGQAWDLNVYVYDKPDLDLSIWLGDKNIECFKKENSLNLNYPKSQIVRFTISENDEIWVNLVDDDEYLDDPIANWKFNSTSMKTDVKYEQNDAKANLEKFKFCCLASQLSD